MKETLKIQYFVEFFSKQTNQNFFSYFNYYQLRMVFFSIIKKEKKYLIIDQCWLFNSHKKKKSIKKNIAFYSHNYLIKQINHRLMLQVHFQIGLNLSI